MYLQVQLWSHTIAFKIGRFETEQNSKLQNMTIIWGMVAAEGKIFGTEVLKIFKEHSKQIFQACEQSSRQIRLLCCIYSPKHLQLRFYDIMLTAALKADSALQRSFE